MSEAIPVRDPDSEELARKREEVIARIQARRDEREHNKQERQALLERTCDPKESVPLFLAEFEERRAELEESLVGVESSARGASPPEVSETRAKLDEIGVQLNALQQYVAESAFFLPPFEIRNSNKMVRELETRLEQTREDVVPKRKFRFRSRRKKQRDGAAKAASENSGARNVSQESKPSESVLSKIAAASQQTKIHDRQGEELTYDALSGVDVWLSNMSDCTLYIKDHLGGLRVDKMRNCRVFVGAVAGSVHLEDCEDCVFVLASRQIRIHENRNCDYYLHVMSKPIIEDSTAVRFAPYAFEYAEHGQHLAAAGLASDANRWQDVDDFNWLKQQHSPNWSVLPEADRQVFRG